MSAQVILSTFTPAEAERITGVSVAMQRDWRRHGFLPPTKGHARFDAFDLAEMLVMRMVADRGIGPASTKDIAAAVGGALVWHALAWIDAYEGDGVPAQSDAPSLPDEIKTITEAATHMLQQVLEGPPHGNRQNTWIGTVRDQVFKIDDTPESADAARLTSSEYFVWWVDGTYTFVPGMYGDDVFEPTDPKKSIDYELSRKFSWDAKLAGPVIILPLKGLAHVLQERAGRAFVRVEGKVEITMRQVNIAAARDATLAAFRAAGPLEFSEAQPVLTFEGKPMAP